MRALILNIAFFTRLPLAKFASYTDERYQKSIKWFPYVGLIIGLFTAIPNIIFKIAGVSNLPLAYIALLNIMVYLMVSGGIHLDGFSDTLDGLLSGRSDERLFEIMKDSRMGAFGTMGLCLYFLTLYTFLQGISLYAIILMPMIGKCCASFIAGISKYPDGRDGMGKWFLEINTPLTSLIHVLIALVITGYLLSVEGIVALLVSLLISLWIRAWVIGKLKGVTGDPIGFIVESSHLIFIVVLQILMRLS